MRKCFWSVLFVVVGMGFFLANPASAQEPSLGAEHLMQVSGPATTEGAGWVMGDPFTHILIGGASLLLLGVVFVRHMREH